MLCERVVGVSSRGGVRKCGVLRKEGSSARRGDEVVLMLRTVLTGARSGSDVYLYGAQ